VEISAALAADLALLSDALDLPGDAITEAVRQLAADAGLAVRSYLGLSVFTAGGQPSFSFVLMADGAEQADIRASLMIPLSRLPGPDVSAVDVSVVLFAAKQGAFVDMAADMAWILGRELDNISVDQHLVADAMANAGLSLGERSMINQALGVLLSRGMTPAQADVELDAHAAGAGMSRHAASVHLLDGVTGPAAPTQRPQG
jgi:hypothetical protein